MRRSAAWLWMIPAAAFPLIWLYYWTIGMRPWTSLVIAGAATAALAAWVVLEDPVLRFIRNHRL